MMSCRLSVTLPSEIHNQIAQLAKQSNRSKSGQIVYLLKQALRLQKADRSLKEEKWGNEN